MEVDRTMLHNVPLHTIGDNVMTAINTAGHIPQENLHQQTVPPQSHPQGLLEKQQVVTAKSRIAVFCDSWWFWKETEMSCRPTIFKAYDSVRVLCVVLTRIR